MREGEIGVERLRVERLMLIVGVLWVNQWWWCFVTMKGGGGPCSVIGKEEDGVLCASRVVCSRD